MLASKTIANLDGGHRDRPPELATVTSRPSEENRCLLGIPENFTYLGAFETRATGFLGIARPFPCWMSPEPFSGPPSHQTSMEYSGERCGVSPPVDCDSSCSGKLNRNVAST
jgi:hypothetical protein